MKKIICVLLACASCLFFFSCDGKRSFKEEEYNEEKHTLISGDVNEIIYIDIDIDDLDIGLYNAIYYSVKPKEDIKTIYPCVISVSTGAYPNGKKYIRKSVIVDGSVVYYNEEQEGKEPEWYKYYG